jgi:hypothetical protein
MKRYCKRGHKRAAGNVAPDGDCRRCKALRAKEYDQRPACKKVRKEWIAIRFKTNQTWINDYLSEHSCVDCGEGNPVVLEFDHVVASKDNRDVTSMMLYSIERIVLEIEKCEVTCSNCHTIRTARRANTLRWRLNS